jgi:hypothetical protein
MTMQAHACLNNNASLPDTKTAEDLTQQIIG